MQHSAVFRATFGAFHLPSTGGGGEQHLARSCARFAQIAIRGPRAEAPAGELLAVFRIEIGLDYLHFVPIAGKFFRNDHRQVCTYTLAHLRSAAPDSYLSG